MIYNTNEKNEEFGIILNYVMYIEKAENNV